MLIFRLFGVEKINGIYLLLLVCFLLKRQKLTYWVLGHAQNHLNKGLLTKGENDQGILARMMTSATVYQMAMVLNLPLSVGLRLASMEPMVTSITATSIMVLCSMPKKRICR